MQIHELKTWPKYYAQIVSGAKRFEIRYNDRDFAVGDLLFLREYNIEIHQYTGRHQLAGVNFFPVA